MGEMSADLYTIRVYFEGESGIVICPGVIRKISKPPEIPGLPKMIGIDYAPGVFHGELQPWQGKRRGMTSTETGMVNTWLGFVQRGEA